MITLSPTKITTAQQLLANYAPAQETLPILAANNGDFADCFDRRRRNNPTSAPSLTGLIVHLISISYLHLDPGIATCVTLYVSKVSIEIFCGHIKATENQ
jgi:hypothetical protein